jgi:phosphoheptose isomerase
MLFVAHVLRDGARLRNVLVERHAQEIEKACQLVVDCLGKGNKVLFCGNGGSAADAQHMAAELVGRHVVERKGLPGIALTVDTSILTAVANDYGFDRVFSRQVEALGQKGDVLVAITTSGGSPNVRNAIDAAREKGMKVLGLTGKKGGAFAKLCDVAICVPSTVTARIQECHITIGHILCEAADIAQTAGMSKANGAGARPTTSSKELSRAELASLRALATASSQTISWTNGAFDLVHAGHLAQLRAARENGDVLVVGVNTDEAVRAAKGADRPIFPLEERVALLAAMEVVDFVHVFTEATPEAALSELKPDVHCKGADYEPPNGKPIPEKALVESYGGRIAYVPLVPDRSTTTTVERLRR